ncbi:MAG: hypothetical protein H0T93_12225 [Chloroflexia bacterium]|nr:hypothetical protein [Chloroflexia bacterium]
MDMFWLIVILIIVIALFAYVAYLYMKEAGDKGPQLWLTGSRKIRESMAARTYLGSTTQRSSPVQDAAPVAEEVASLDLASSPRQIAPRNLALALDDEALRDLREEFQHELRQAVGRSREFDVRLTRIETSSGEPVTIPVQVSEEIAGLRDHHRVEIERLQVSLESVRERAGSYGERRGVALAELYSCLARVESALAAVVNPMLLPGEPLSIPRDLPAEALVWDTWGDVGERAYGLGNIFNENRLVLDAATGDAIAEFIATLRQGLTGSIYPNVRLAKPSADQLAQMRSGLEAIVAELPNVRRTIEDAYRDDTA